MCSWQINDDDDDDDETAMKLYHQKIQHRANALELVVAKSIRLVSARIVHYLQNSII